VVVLVVAGEFEQLPVEKSEICIAPPDQLFDLPQSEYPATKEVRRDALLTGRQARLALAVAVAEEAKRDALRTVGEPYRLALPGAEAEEIKRDALRTVDQPSRLAPPGGAGKR
jgi:hypothetical protein